MRGYKTSKLTCSNCESAQMILIGNNIAECSVCKAVKSV